MSKPRLPQFLTKEEITRALKISDATLYNWMKKQGFPEPIRLTEATLRWRQDQIEEWLSDREQLSPWAPTRGNPSWLNGDVEDEKNA